MNLNDLSLEELKASLAIVDDELVSKNLISFIRQKLKTTYDNNPVLIPWYYEEWYAYFKKYKRIKIECSRDHGKSNFSSFALPLWLASENPNYPVDIFSYSEDQAVDKLRKIRSKIETDKTFHHLMDKRKSYAWSDNLLEFPNGSSIGAFGFNSSYRGRHPKDCIIDDPSKDYAAMPVEDQEKYLLSVIEPAVGPKNRILVMGTPIENDDLLERLDTHPAYHSFKYPCITNGKPVWPERYSLEDLAQARINSRYEWVFSREYMLDRVDADTSVFKSSLFKFDNHCSEEMYKVITLDPAITRGGDTSAFVVIGTDANNKTWVLDAEGLRTNEVTQIMDKIFELHQKWQPDVFGIEAIGFQRLLAYWLEEEMGRRNYHFPIIEIKINNMIDSKKSRILEIEPELRSGNLYFCFGARIIVEQLKKWNPKSKKNKDDFADSLAAALRLKQHPENIDKPVPENCYDVLAAKLDRINTHEYMK